MSRATKKRRPVKGRLFVLSTSQPNGTSSYRSSKRTCTHRVFVDLRDVHVERRFVEAVAARLVRLDLGRYGLTIRFPAMGEVRLVLET